MASVTREQKERLYRDGYIVLPGAVPAERVQAARRTIFSGIGRLRADALTLARHGGDAAADRVSEAARRTAGGGGEAVFMDLFGKTAVTEIVRELIGEVLPVRGCQLPTNFPTEPGDHVNESGYRDRDTPFHGWHGHLDGLWNGASRIHQHTDRPMTDAERAAWFRDPASNGCRREFPDLGANVMGFTALVAVALSDQTREGVGNLGLLKGAHHHMERFFRRQRAAGGPLGPDGPFWPRMDAEAPNGGGLRHYPDEVREAFADGAEQTPDGKRWPKPTLLRMAPGDAAIVLHAVPHCATRVEGAEPRMMAYFRITSAARAEANRRVCPDALCDIWSEWPGMADVVGRLRGAA